MRCLTSPHPFLLLGCHGVSVPVLAKLHCRSTVFLPSVHGQSSGHHSDDTKTDMHCANCAAAQSSQCSSWFGLLFARCFATTSASSSPKRWWPLVADWFLSFALRDVFPSLVSRSAGRWFVAARVKKTTAVAISSLALSTGPRCLASWSVWTRMTVVTPSAGWFPWWMHLALCSHVGSISWTRLLTCPLLCASRCLGEVVILPVAVQDSGCRARCCSTTGAWFSLCRKLWRIRSCSALTWWSMSLLCWSRQCSRGVSTGAVLGRKSATRG